MIVDGEPPNFNANITHVMLIGKNTYKRMLRGIASLVNMALNG